MSHKKLKEKNDGIKVLRSFLITQLGKFWNKDFYRYR